TCADMLEAVFIIMRTMQMHKNLLTESPGSEGGIDECLGLLEKLYSHKAGMLIHIFRIEKNNEEGYYAINNDIAKSAVEDGDLLEMLLE
ncbi:MAG: hypothetical protein ACRCX2_28930, partial [Paraclostridium sp.]